MAHNTSLLPTRISFETCQRQEAMDSVVTSNHIHLLVVDGGERETIPKSIQLTAGRCAQEYNLRKKRKGAYWEDRYHAAAIESANPFLK